ncbi:MAG: FAD-binding oxidoreductase, partial [Acidimicrobiales bacterium]
MSARESHDFSRGRDVNGRSVAPDPGPGTAQLEAELRATVKGQVRFDAGTRAMYSTDASNYRQVPLGVVLPEDADDVAAAVAACRAAGVAVLPRGGGTSLAGQACNEGLVIDCSRSMAGIVELDPDARTATVLPGTVLDDLRRAAEEHHLTYGPDPATHDRCTIGGMIGNNSCGVHSIIAGRTVDNVDELELLTYDGLRLRVGPTTDAEVDSIVAAGGRRGEIYGRLRELRDRFAPLIRERYPDIPRRVSGYNLDELLPERGFDLARALVGTEGTCVTVLSAAVRLVPSPPSRAMVVLAYPDVWAAADAVPDVMSAGPIGLEGFDDLLVGYERRKGVDPAELELLPEGGGWLLAEVGGDTPGEAEAAARRLAGDLGAGQGGDSAWPRARVVADPG